PIFYPEAGSLLQWGILLWYTSLGGLIGVAGVFDYHPILKLPMPWWFRGPLLGAWMNFVLTFFTFDLMSGVMATVFNEDGVLQSPFWLVAEGAAVGLVIGFFATRFGGEGKAAVLGD
ncbi:MAG: hypothetical protein O3A84_07200, partial [Proteobacteria bacterium]|nr:hypothetical protein [Pseudomonadota bacterium]